MDKELTRDVGTDVGIIGICLLIISIIGIFREKPIEWWGGYYNQFTLDFLILGLSFLIISLIIIYLPHFLNLNLKICKTYNEINTESVEMKE